MPCHFREIIHDMTILCVYLYINVVEKVNELNGIIFLELNNLL